MKYELKSIGYWSFTKISFIVNLILGFLIGVMYAMFMGMILQFSSAFQAYGMSELDSGALPFGMLMIIMPLMFSLSSAFFNTILGLILVFIYNFFSRFFGGLEFEMEIKEVKDSQIIAPLVPQTPPVSERFETPPPPPPVDSVPPPPPVGTTPPPYVETVTPTPAASPEIQPKPDETIKPATENDNNNKKEE